MPVRLLFLTKDPEIGRIAERAGVDWIFVDLEYRGKTERQAGRDTVISAHTIDDVVAMRSAIRSAQLLVRVNPIGEWSKKEIEATIAAGADVLMLPFFRSKAEVAEFVALAGGRTRTCLLVETMAAVEAIEEILAVPGIDFVHIGLNDIHIERKTRFMFELFADGTLDALAAKIRPTGIPFGIGGMARIGERVPPAEAILAEHYRLGSSGVILSRAFVAGANSLAEIEQLLVSGVREVRACEAELVSADAAFFETNRLRTRDQIYQVAEEIGRTASA